jgi:hypothetical protein
MKGVGTPLRVAEGDGMRRGGNASLVAEGFIRVFHAMYGDTTLQDGSRK